MLPEDTKTTKYEHVLPALVAIEQDRSIEGLLILLNTMGGDVEAGLAIAEVIAGMQTPRFHWWWAAVTPSGSLSPSVRTFPSSCPLPL